MKHILVALISFFAVVSVPCAAVAQKASVESLGWMAGCWELNARNGSMLVAEQWMKPAGGTLIGMSRTVRDGKTIAWEFVRIATDPDGISYIAKPHQNKDETVFKIAKWSPSELVFENLAHDFPQRIIYRNSGPDELFARVEGSRNGKLSGTDIPMKRVKCEQTSGQ